MLLNMLLYASMRNQVNVVGVRCVICYMLVFVVVVVGGYI